MFWIVWLIVMAMPLAAFASPNWPNEPAGFTPFLEKNFDTLPACDTGPDGNGWDLAFCNASQAYVGQDGTARLSPPNVATFKRIVGDGGGGQLTHPICPSAGVACNDAQGGMTEGFIGAWFMISNPFRIFTGVEKIFNVSMQSGAIWIEFYGDPDNAPFGPFVLGANLVFNAVFENAFNDRNGTPVVKTNNCHLPGSGQCPGPYNLGPNHTRPNLTVGVWHQIEVYFKYSTCDTCRNGTFKMWQDGTLTYDYSTMNFPPPSDGTNYFWITQAWDQPDPNVTQPQYEYWDHVYISKGPGTADPGRLPKPTGLTAQ